MAITKVTKVYGVDDFKVFPITADTDSTFTCGAAIDGVGVKQVSLTFEMEEKDLTGDEMTLDTIAKVKSISGSTEVAKFNLPLWAELTGGTVTDATTSSTLSIGSNASGNQKYLQFQFQIKTTDNEGGDLHFVIYKAKATSAPINGTEDDYATFTIDFKGVFTTHKFGTGTAAEHKLLNITVNETATDLAAVVDA
jgi:hypothetical protein